jgi:maleate isomerase
MDQRIMEGHMSDDGGIPRARIGLIIPSSNRLTEPQFHRYCPPGVVPHVTRLRITQPPRRLPLEMLDEIREAAILLGHAKCDITVFHCTGSSMEAGLDAERQIVEAIARTTGHKATSTASAVRHALRALEVRRLVLVSPYRGNDHEIEFLREAGFDVLHDRALALDGSDGLCSAPAELFLTSTLEEADPDADAYFISCTNIRSPEVVTELEARLGRPVVTSNQATLWYCLRACGLSDVVPDLGALFHVGLPATAIA